MQLKLTKLPLIGFLFSLRQDSYYDESVIEKALQDTFASMDSKQMLFCEPSQDARDSTGPDTLMRALKAGVTAVNVIDNHTILMTNYNRKIQNIGRLIPRWSRSYVLTSRR
jgi:hypothetical protein